MIQANGNYSDKITTLNFYSVFEDNDELPANNPNPTRIKVFLEDLIDESDKLEIWRLEVTLSQSIIAEVQFLMAPTQG